MQDLLTRLFLNLRTSLDGVIIVLLAWLGSNGIDLSEANRTKLLGYAGIAAAAIWKLFSKDPVPQPEAGAGK